MTSLTITDLAVYNTLENLHADRRATISLLKALAPNGIEVVCSVSGGKHNFVVGAEKAYEMWVWNWPRGTNLKCCNQPVSARPFDKDRDNEKDTYENTGTIGSTTSGETDPEQEEDDPGVQ